MEIKRERKAFTLVEILLYFGLVSMLVVTITSFVGVILSSRNKNEAISEVEQQSIVILEDIARTIKNADSINSPTPGNSSSTLSIDSYDIGIDPTIYTLSGGAVTIQEGVGSPVTLSSNKVNVSSLNFENLTYAGSDIEVIRVTMTVSYLNASGFSDSSFTKDYFITASTR